jgi:Zn-dependent M28 family amino/carboxypeptidase
MRLQHLLLPLGLSLTVACGGPKAPQTVAELPNLDTNRVLTDITRLSADEMQGRAPGSEGERLTVQYLTDQFKAAGLEPGNPDGTWVQKVPLVGIRPSLGSPFTIKQNGKVRQMNVPGDIVPFSRRVAETVSVADSEMVFVGYGIQAPEFQWDDYKGVDVKGKTILMLVNDPQIAGSGPGGLDPKVFGGKAMTYYGRWTYKFDKAAEMGAAAVLVIHETGPAGYPYAVAQAMGGERFNLSTPDKNMDKAAVQGWISLEATTALFKGAGFEFDALKARATTREFTPVPLQATASVTLKQATRSLDSHNVVAKITGSDNALKDEYVIYTAHWDHFGRNTSLQGDQILNGALDNASGVAQMLEIAKAFTKLPTPPKRSVLFLAVTAEEAGLLGAKYYAQHPLYALDKTLANINIDGANQWGRTSDVVLIGLGNSTLDDVLDSVVTASGRTIVPDPESEKGFFYRSDHFEFAKEGVPALYADAGVKYVGKPEGWGLQKRNEYTTNDYHKPTDEVKPDWDLSGAVEDGQMLFEVGYRIAQATTWPDWKPGTEFKAKRDAMLGKQ